jgi:hypothetical protein
MGEEPKERTMNVQDLMTYLEMMDYIQVNKELVLSDSTNRIRTDKAVYSRESTTRHWIRDKV